jgi:hypothetical protein
MKDSGHQIDRTASFAVIGSRMNGVGARSLHGMVRHVEYQPPFRVL